MILDTTCGSADISYPTDLKILNQARQQTEKIIDVLHKNRQRSSDQKPRTYREVAKKDYLAVAKQGRPSRKERQKAIKKQLQYITRNLGYIDQLIAAGTTLSSLNKKQYKSVLVVAEVYCQQQ